MSVKFAHLRVPKVVVEGSSPNLDVVTFPSDDSVEHRPLSSKVWKLETPVNNNVFMVTFTNELDIIDDQSIRVGSACAFEIKFVFSSSDLNVLIEGSEWVAAWINLGDQVSIPKDFASAGMQRHIAPTGVLEL